MVKARERETTTQLSIFICRNVAILFLVFMALKDQEKHIGHYKLGPKFRHFDYIRNKENCSSRFQNYDY
jgi:hypothetical protein